MNKSCFAYIGDTNAIINQGYLSLTLHKDWFFSKDKNCYGIPVSFECTDITGDAFFSIRLQDEKNNLDFCLSLDYCQKYNAVIWIDRNFEDIIEIIDTSITFCGKGFPQTIEVAFRNACLSENVDADWNKACASNCYSNLEVNELWNLRSKSWSNIDGIVLDTFLQDKLKSTGYIVSDRSSGFDSIYYVWSGLQIGGETEIYRSNPGKQAGTDVEMNGLKVLSMFNYHVTPDDKRLPVELVVFVSDKNRPDYSKNNVCRGKYESDMVIWENYNWTVDWKCNLSNLIISIEPDEINGVLEKGYIDIEVKYQDSDVLLRVVLEHY